MSEEFAEWLKREMPAGTVISDPEWWAPRILKAARTAPAEPVIWVDIPPGDQRAGWYPGYKFEGLSNLDPGKYRLYTAPDALQAEVERLNKEADENTAEWETVRLELAEAKADADEAIRLIREAWRLLPGEDTISHSVWHLAASEFLDAARTAKPEVKS
ncbi:Uncharacterised protein [Pseudomonas luteola]|uniref:Uncharacterized protein n=1 Tax=Pseudomonas luteola TaxID=47886 RepID=A0A2X2CG23_PSELU|nr:hypothetical protein [Pseudomonas luteola]SPZ07622.1 Uncharacterised protein [Pseudomonas luteola]